MWKQLLLTSALWWILFLQTAANNICDNACTCEESDAKPGMLTVSCIKLGLTELPQVESWPLNTYTMDVSFNNITVVDSLEHQETIRVLKLISCRLTSIKPSVFSVYPFLKNLDISENNLKDLDTDTFLGLEKLLVLNMSKNIIRKLPDNLFDNLVLLEELKLSDNPLRYLEMTTFKVLDKLVRLDISNIQAHTLNDGIFHYMANLKVLDLSGNEFEEVPDSALKSAPKLEELYFNENKVKEFNEDSFKDLTQLKILELNEISTLRTVKERTFSSLKSLNRLKMFSNPRLNYIHSSAFDGIYNPADINSLQLKEVSLRNNDLPTLDAYILPWCQIEMLDLQGNPWFCDCTMQWIINCSFPAQFSMDLKCYGPKKLKYRSLNQISQEEFVCLHEMAPRYSETQVRTIVAITGLVLALVISIALVLFIKRRSIRVWWSFRRRGQGAVYYVKAHTNPVDNPEL